MRKFVINVNGNSYEVEVEEVGVENTAKNSIERPVVSAPIKAEPEAPQKALDLEVEPKKEVMTSAGQEVIEAPMPGSIYKIAVKEGDSVKEGDILLILEAMKMENEILAPRDGKVSSINTTEGKIVNVGEKLVVLD